MKLTTITLAIACLSSGVYLLLMIRHRMALAKAERYNHQRARYDPNYWPYTPETHRSQTVFLCFAIVTWCCYGLLRWWP